jgi:nicotinamidase-related amidase
MSGSSASDPRTARIERPAVVLIDAQPGFLEIASGPREAVDLRLEKLLVLADCLDLPTLATFENPQDSGWLTQRCEAVWPVAGVRLEKRYYDCCRHPEIADAVTSLGREQLLVAGAETDVCLLQSVLSFLDRGYTVFLLEDCLFSTEPHVDPALRRMEAAGAVPCTLKTAYYELMRSVHVFDDPSSGGPGWEDLLQRFGQPEKWPSWR